MERSEGCITVNKQLQHSKILSLRTRVTQTPNTTFRPVSGRVSPARLAAGPSGTAGVTRTCRSVQLWDSSGIFQINWSSHLGLNCLGCMIHIIWCYWTQNSSQFQNKLAARNLVTTESIVSLEIKKVPTSKQIPSSFLLLPIQTTQEWRRSNWSTLFPPWWQSLGEPSVFSSDSPSWVSGTDWNTWQKWRV